MSLSLVYTDDTTVYSSGATSLNITINAGVAAGDLIVITYFCRSNNTPPAGFTKHAEIVYDSIGGRQGFYVKQATGSEGGTIITVTQATSNRMEAMHSIFRGDNPLVASQTSTLDGGSTTTGTLPTLTEAVKFISLSCSSNGFGDTTTSPVMSLDTGADVEWAALNTTTASTSNQGRLAAAYAIYTGADTTRVDWRVSGSASGKDWGAGLLTIIEEAGGGVTLTVHDSVQGQSFSQASLTQHNILAPDNQTQAQQITAPTLLQHHVLAVNSSTQAQTFSEPVLTQAFVLVVADASQAQTQSSPSLLQHHQLSPNSSTQAQALDQPALTVSGSLAVDGVVQGQAVGSPSLVQHHAISPDALSQGQSFSDVVLAMAGSLAVDDSAQSQEITQPDLLQHYVLTVDALVQAQAVGNVTLTAGNALAVLDSTQVQSLTAATLTQYGMITVDSLTQAQIESIVMFGGVVVGRLDGRVVIYSALDGKVEITEAISGTVTIN